MNDIILAVQTLADAPCSQFSRLIETVGAAELGAVLSALEEAAYALRKLEAVAVAEHGYRAEEVAA